MKDERIEQAKNKIRSEMAIIILYGVAVSFLVKTVVFKMDLLKCITEYLILIFFPLYQFIRMHMMKISIYSQRGNKRSLRNLLIAIAILVIASAVSIFNRMTESEVYVWQNSAAAIFAFLILFVAIYCIVNKYNQFRSHKYEEEFKDDK